MPRAESNKPSYFQVNFGGGSYLRFTPKEDGSCLITVTPNRGGSVTMGPSRVKALLKALGKPPKRGGQDALLFDPVSYNRK